VWLVTGVVAGAASSLYAERKLRRTLEAASARLQPDALVTEVGRSARQAARSTGGRVREAVATGRREMQRREEEIWAGLTVPPPDGATPGEVPVGAASPSGRPATGEPSRPVPGDTAADPTHPARGRGRRLARRSPSHLGK
jgi:hypothetical protein